MSEFIYKSETYRIIGAAMEVHKNLGCGFLEAIYQEALELELKICGIPYEREKVLNIFYKDHKLKKEYCVDFFCFDNILVELKATSGLTGVDESQLLNYLKATQKKLGLLFNFGTPSLEYTRMVR